MPLNSFSAKRLKLIAQKYTDVVERESMTGNAVFIQQGARLLGLYPLKEGPNLLWVNSELELILKERQPFVGGDRIWMSPERNYFYENPRDFEGFHIPSEIDPGEYKYLENLKTSDLSIVYENRFSLLEYDNNNIFDDNVARRQFSTIPDPYKTKVPYMGISITDTLAVNNPDVRMSVSSVSQITSGGYKASGTALISRSKQTDLASYYHEVPGAEWFEQKESYTRIRIDSLKRFRFGVVPEALDHSNPCRVAYIAPNPANRDQWTCIVKRSGELPDTSRECVDVSKIDPDRPGSALQIFNSGPDADRMQESILFFGELQLVFTKGKKVGKKTVSKATHEILGYCGTKEEMQEVALKALNLSDIPELY